MPIVDVRGLTKTYVSHKKQSGFMGSLRSLVTREKTEVEAVKQISFQIEQGELVGFLGPNGAGKTTTLKMLSGILYPTGGEASVLGHTPWERPKEMQRQISLVMGQKMQLWWDLPAIESFVLLKELYEVSESNFNERLHGLAETLEVSHLLNTQMRKMSLGERMKCELIAALLHAPRVVFLDEPTIGLDVVSQKRIREFLKSVNRLNQTTILLTSHYMADVEALCERVLIIDHGQLLFDNDLASLVAQHSHTKLLRLQFSDTVSREDLERFGKVIECEGLKATLEAPRAETTRIAADTLTHLPVEDITIDEVDVDEVIREIFTRNAALKPGSVAR